MLVLLTLLSTRQKFGRGAINQAVARGITRPVHTSALWGCEVRFNVDYATQRPYHFWSCSLWPFFKPNIFSDKTVATCTAS